MKKFLYVLILALAIWLIITPFVLGAADWLRRGIDLAAGLVVVIFAFLGFRTPKAKYPAWIALFLGLAMIVWGAIARPLTGGPGGASEIIVGVLWFLLALVITQLFDFPKLSAYVIGGNELASMSLIRYKKNNLLLKAVLLGTMPSTIYIRPEELWKMLALIDASVIWHLPSFLYQGWKRARQLAGQAESKPSSPTSKG